jgi:hypothetical protein
VPFVPTPPILTLDPRLTSPLLPPSLTAEPLLAAVRGLDLRHAALVVLDRRGGEPCTIPEMLADLAVLGVCPASARPRKELADAMRWEVARGRVERVAVGVYQIGYLPRTTRWRARQVVRVAVETRRGVGPGDSRGHGMRASVPAPSDVAPDHVDPQAAAWSVLQRRR